MSTPLYEMPLMCVMYMMMFMKCSRLHVRSSTRLQTHAKTLYIYRHDYLQICQIVVDCRGHLLGRAHPNFSIIKGLQSVDLRPGFCLGQGTSEWSVRIPAALGTSELQERGLRAHRRHQHLGVPVPQQAEVC